MLATLASIWFLHVAPILSPGANVLLVSQLAASDRARSALFAAVGITVGAGLWAAFAVLGVDAVFAAFPRLRLVLQIVGGLYLLYLASRLWRSGSSHVCDDSRTVSAATAWQLGFLTNIPNPKAALFYGSVSRLRSEQSEPAAQGARGHADRGQRPDRPLPGGAAVLEHTHAARLRPPAPHRQPDRRGGVRRPGIGAARRDAAQALW